MSDLLIRGMELPENCWSCRMFCNCFACEGYDCHCAALGKDIGTEAEVPRNKRRDDCPLVPVPPHGRLIDVAVLWVEINKICDRRDAGIISDLTCLQQLLSAVRHAPTIIQAEEVKA